MRDLAYFGLGCSNVESSKFISTLKSLENKKQSPSFFTTWCELGWNSVEKIDKLLSGQAILAEARKRPCSDFKVMQSFLGEE